MSRYVSLDLLLIAAGLGLAGGFIALIVRLAKGDGVGALLRALETALTTTAGALLARAAIVALLDLGHRSDAAVAATSVFMLIWPGVANLPALLGGGSPAVGAGSLEWIAFAAGAGIGFFDGLWGVYRWAGEGIVTFVLDLTWGLPGSVNGLLLHLINAAWAGHADDGGSTGQETRLSTHRYLSGFCLNPSFAFSQGNVLSNMNGHAPGSPLHDHETIHVWQNRVLGPFFWFSYIGWMAMLLVPAAIGGLISPRRDVGETIFWWCYFDDPWEVMAYGIANSTSRTGRTASDGSRIGNWLCWPIWLALPLNLAGLALLFWAFVHLAAGVIQGL